MFEMICKMQPILHCQLEGVSSKVIDEGYCNTPDVTFPICTPTLAVFGVKLFYFPRVRVFFSVCCFHCHASHIMSSCALHSHTCSSLAFEHFPHCPFCIPALLCPPVSPFTFFRVRVLNFLGMDRGLSSGLGIAPVDRLSSFGSFGGCLVLQRLTG